MSKLPIVYNVRFIVPGNQLGQKKTSCYKNAVKEAEGWVLSDKHYTATIEWETFTGKKTVSFDYSSVQEQRKIRNAYKNNKLSRNSYVGL